MALAVTVETVPLLPLSRFVTTEQETGRPLGDWGLLLTALPVLPADRWASAAFAPVLPETGRPRRLINHVGWNRRRFAATAQEGGNQCAAE